MYKLVLWTAYFVFLAVVVMMDWHPDLLVVQGSTGVAKVGLIGLWLGFLVYSLYCSARENLFSAYSG